MALEQEQPAGTTTEAAEATETTEIPKDTDINSGTLRYPMEKQDRYQAYIKFTQCEIIPPGMGEATKQALDDTVSKTTKAASVAEESSDGGVLDLIGDFFNALLFGGDDEENNNNDPSSVDGTDPTAAGDIITSRKVEPKGDPTVLYLPTSLVFNDGLQYDTPALGIAGAVGFNAAAQGGGAIKTLSNAMEESFKSVSDAVLGNFKTGDLARLGAIRLLDKIPGAGAVQEGASIAAGVTINPNVRASFKGVAIREFSFQFKFIPRSKEESEVVEKIIKRFRYAAYPESLNADPNATFDEQGLGNLALGYKFPDLFHITVKYKTESGEVRVGNRFDLCFLKGISTNYNPSSMSFHADGKPVEIDLTLNFVEQKTIDRRAVAEGY